MPNRTTISAPDAHPFEGYYHGYTEQGYTGPKSGPPRNLSRGERKAFAVRQPFHEYHYWEWFGTQGQRTQHTIQHPEGVLYGGVNVEHDVRGSLDSGLLAMMHPDTVSTASQSVSFVRGKPRIEREQELVNKLRLKMSKPEANLGVMLAEYGETAKLFGSVASNIFGSVMLARSGNIPGAVLRLLAADAAPRGRHPNRSHAMKRKVAEWRDIANESANTWLGLQYGILPLIADVSDTVEAFAKRHEERPGVLRFATKGTTELKGLSHVRDRTGWASSLSGQPGWRYRAEHIAAEQTIHYVLEMVESNPFTRKLSQLGVTNVASIAWETVPFSFVVDWFFPVGDYLQGVMPPTGLDFRKGYKTVKGSGKITRYESLDGWIESPPGSSSSVINGSYAATATREETWKERRFITDLPSYNYVQPDISLNKTQVLNGTALLWQIRNLLK